MGAMHGHVGASAKTQMAYDEASQPKKNSIVLEGKHRMELDDGLIAAKVGTDKM